MHRLSALLIALLVLPMMACHGPSAWMAGIDPGSYDWVPLVGTKHDKSAAQDLRDCEAPGGPEVPAKPDAAKDVTIARAEGSPMVEACMDEKGYAKVYQSTSTMF
jgi:hypothetical protein